MPASALRYPKGDARGGQFRPKVGAQFKRILNPLALDKARRRKQLRRGTGIPPSRRSANVHPALPASDRVRRSALDRPPGGRMVRDLSPDIEFPKSKGHLEFIGGFEYLKGPDGDLYRAKVNAPIDSTTGYRQGARFEARGHMTDTMLRLARESNRAEPDPVVEIDGKVLDAIRERGLDKGLDKIEKGPTAKRVLGDAVDTQEIHSKVVAARELRLPADQDYVRVDENGAANAPGSTVRVGDTLRIAGGQQVEVKKVGGGTIVAATREQRVYTAERKKLHDEIVAAALEGHKPPGRVGDADVNAKPHALFLAGGTASGKSTGLARLEEEGGLPPDAVTIDPDAIKERLPEYAEMAAAHDPYSARGAHEESSDIAKRIQAEAMGLGLNVVIDGTGNSPPGRFAEKLDKAAAQGYAVDVVVVNAPTPRAIERAMARAQRTGRYVPVPAIREIHQSVSARHLEWRDNPNVASWRVYDNGGGKGGGATLVARGGGGNAPKVYDARLYADFRAKADEKIEAELVALRLDDDDLLEAYEQLGVRPLSREPQKKQSRAEILRARRALGGGGSKGGGGLGTDTPDWLQEAFHDQVGNRVYRDRGGNYRYRKPGNKPGGDIAPWSDRVRKRYGDRPLDFHRDATDFIRPQTIGRDAAHPAREKFPDVADLGNEELDGIISRAPKSRLRWSNRQKAAWQERENRKKARPQAAKLQGQITALEGRMRRETSRAKRHEIAKRINALRRRHFALTRRAAETTLAERKPADTSSKGVPVEQWIPWIPFDPGAQDDLEIGYEGDEPEEKDMTEATAELTDHEIEEWCDRLFEAVPNFKLVGARARGKLSPLMRHYGKMAHPFTACVADNTKRFGPERAKRVCAVLKDLIRGTTKWRSTERKLADCDVADLVTFSAEVDDEALTDFAEWLADTDTEALVAALAAADDEGVREMAELETVDLVGVDVMAAGGPYFGTGSPKGGDTYTVADLKRIAKSMSTLGREVKPRNYLGHDPSQPLLTNSGVLGDDQLPAAGWLTNFRVKDKKLLADVKRVPKKVAELMKVGAFRTRSVGLKKLVSQTTGEKHLVIDHLAWLGKKAPAIRTLDDIYALYQEAAPVPADIEGFEIVGETEIRYEGDEVVWSAREGLNYLRDKLQAALPRSDVGGSGPHYWIRDVAPGKVLIEDSSKGQTSAFVATFTIEGDRCILQPPTEWTEASQEWVAAARRAEQEYRERVSAGRADTTGEMPDEITISPDAVAAFAEKMDVEPEDVTEETLASYLEELEEQAASGDGDGDGDGDGKKDPPAPTGTQLADSELSELKAQAADGAAARRELNEMKRDGLIDGAIADCKIEPASKESWQKRYDESPELVTTILSEMKPDDALLKVYGDDGDGLDESGREKAAKDEDALYRQHMEQSHGITIAQEQAA